MSGTRILGCRDAEWYTLKGRQTRLEFASGLDSLNGIDCATTFPKAASRVPNAWDPFGLGVRRGRRRSGRARTGAQLWGVGSSVSRDLLFRLSRRSKAKGQAGSETLLDPRVRREELPPMGSCAREAQGAGDA